MTRNVRDWRYVLWARPEPGERWRAYGAGFLLALGAYLLTFEALNRGNPVVLAIGAAACAVGAGLQVLWIRRRLRLVPGPAPSHRMGGKDYGRRTTDAGGVATTFGDGSR